MKDDFSKPLSKDSSTGRKVLASCSGCFIICFVAALIITVLIML